MRFWSRFGVRLVLVSMAIGAIRSWLIHRNELRHGSEATPYG